MPSELPANIIININAIVQLLTISVLGLVNDLVSDWLYRCGLTKYLRDKKEYQNQGSQSDQSPDNYLVFSLQISSRNVPSSGEYSL